MVWGRDSQDFTRHFSALGHVWRVKMYLSFLPSLEAPCVDCVVVFHAFFSQVQKSGPV
jgi:hypothetical protein